MNVRMMLLSKIGAQYDPATAKGTVGRNYCYQTSAGARLMFEDKHFNPFIGAGSLGMTIDDFNGDAFDHSKLDFVGGAGISCTVTNGRPISNRPTAPGSPRWGAKWKQATVEGYQNAMGFGSPGLVLSGAGELSGSGSHLYRPAWPAAAAQSPSISPTMMSPCRTMCRTSWKR